MAYNQENTRRYRLKHNKATHNLLLSKSLIDEVNLFKAKHGISSVDIFKAGFEAVKKKFEPKRFEDDEFDF